MKKHNKVLITINHAVTCLTLVATFAIFTKGVNPIDKLKFLPLALLLIKANSTICHFFFASRFLIENILKLISLLTDNYCGFSVLNKFYQRLKSKWQKDKGNKYSKISFDTRSKAQKRSRNNSDKE